MAPQNFNVHDLSGIDRLFSEGATLSSNFSAWLTVALFLFLTGLIGMAINYKNFLHTMMAAELMYLGAILSFLFYGIGYGDARASIYALLILIFAACESAVGLGILTVLNYYDEKSELKFDYFSQLHG